MFSRHRLFGVMLALIAVVSVMACQFGCGRARKEASQAREGARVAREMQDEGQVTVTNEEGETVTIKAEEGDEGKGSVSIEGDEGKVKIDVEGDEDDASWTMTDEKGETAVGTVTRDVSEDDIGLKFYPGAEVEHGSKGSTTAGEGASWTLVSLVTEDPVEKVADFYKKAYAEASQVIEAADSVHIIVAGSGAQGKTITISPDEEEKVTRIVLSAGSQ